MGVTRRAAYAAAILLVAPALVVLGPAGPAAAAGCLHPSTTDVDGDGLSDMVQGQPYRRVTSGNTVIEGAASMIRGGNSGGATAVDSQLFSEFSLKVVEGDPAYDLFGTNALLADFTGDCRADLLVGLEDGDDGSAGAVIESDDSLFGLYNLGTRIDGDALIPGSEWVGTVLAAGDFNGDGFADAAIGSWQDWSGQAAYKGGSVVVLYGGTHGLEVTGRQVWNFNTPGVPGTGQSDSRFGWSITTGDFNGDGYADLATGAPFESVGGVARAGAVVVLNGSPAGLTATGAQMFTEGAGGIGGTAEADDQFGGQVAAGDVTGDGRDDLVVAATGEVDAGAHGTIFLLKGTAGGLGGTGSQFRDQHSTGFPTAPALAPLGQSLAVADFNGDGYADIAAGAGTTTVSGAAGAGAVALLYGYSGGLSTTGATILTEDTPGVPGGAEPGDSMGQSLRVLADTSTGYPALVVGVPGESSSGHTRNGGFIVFHGGPGALTVTGSAYFDGDDLAGQAGDNSGLSTDGPY